MAYEQAKKSQRHPLRVDWTKFDEVIEINQRYLEIPRLGREEGIVSLVSPTGSGKTEVISHLPRGDKVLALTPKRNGVKQFIERFDWFEDHYNHTEGKTERVLSASQLGDYTHRVMTAVSLNRFEDRLSIPDILFIDEPPELMRLSIAGKTSRWSHIDSQRRFNISAEEALANEEILQYLIRETPLVITAQARLDNYCVDYFSRFNRNYRCYQNLYKNKRKTPLSLISNEKHLARVVEAKTSGDKSNLIILENSVNAIHNYDWIPKDALVIDATDVRGEVSFESAEGLRKSFGAAGSTIVSTPVVSSALSFTDVEQAIVAAPQHKRNRFLTGEQLYQMLSRARNADYYGFMPNPKPLNEEGTLENTLNYFEDIRSENEYRVEKPNSYDRFKVFEGRRWRRSVLDYRAFYYRIIDGLELRHRDEVACIKWVEDGGSLVLETDNLPLPEARQLKTILTRGKRIDCCSSLSGVSEITQANEYDYWYTAACKHNNKEEIDLGDLWHWLKGKAQASESQSSEPSDISEQNDLLGGMNLQLHKETYYTSTGFIGLEQFCRTSVFQRLINEKLVFNRLMDCDELRHLRLPDNFKRSPLIWLEAFLRDFGINCVRKPYDPAESGSKAARKNLARKALNQYFKRNGLAQIKSYADCYEWCIQEGIANQRIPRSVVDFIHSYEKEILVVRFGT